MNEAEEAITYDVDSGGLVKSRRPGVWMSRQRYDQIQAQLALANDVCEKVDRSIPSCWRSIHESLDAWRASR